MTYRSASMTRNLLFFAVTELAELDRLALVAFAMLGLNSYTRTSLRAERKASLVKPDRVVPNFFAALSTAFTRFSSKVICTVFMSGPPDYSYMYSYIRQHR